MEQIFRPFVVVVLAEMMFAMGLRLDFSGLRNSLSVSPGLVLRAMLINFLGVPALTLLLVMVAQLPPMTAAALLILAAAPGAPYVPPFTLYARGNFRLSVGVMVLLAGSSALFTPLILSLLIPVGTGGPGVTIDTVPLTGTLFAVQLLPLCLGMALRQWRPNLAARFEKPAVTASKVLNALMVIGILLLQYRQAAMVSLPLLLVIILLLPASAWAGWLAGGSDRSDRKALGISTALRNMSLGMVIASGSFAGTAVLPAILVAAVVTGTGLLALAHLWRRNSVG